jgi:hypothetical protein
MAGPNGWPVVVVPVGALGTGSSLFRAQGELRALLVVKAAFQLRPGRHATLGPAPAVRRADEHRSHSPLCSLRAASDLAPFRERCDVSLVGHCHAPAGRTVQAAAVRLTLYQGRELLVDKRLYVHGDRKRAEDPAAPFERMPLVYERAFGGAGCAENPVGVGLASTDPQPNLLCPADPRRPAGFGPISRYWRMLQLGLSEAARQALAEPIVEIPERIDWSYFQSVPADQQCRPLSGEEWLLLEGMHPTEARLQCGLPSVRAEARLWSRAATRTHPGLPIALRADDLAIDMDAERFTVCWRGSFPVPTVEALSGVRVGAALSLRGEAIDWGPFWARVESGFDASGCQAAPSPAVLEVSLERTTTLCPDDDGEPPVAPAALPFRPAGTFARGGEAEPKRKPAETAALPAVDPGSFGGTPALPFERRERPSSLPPPRLGSAAKETPVGTVPPAPPLPAAAWVPPVGTVRPPPLPAPAWVPPVGTVPPPPPLPAAWVPPMGTGPPPPPSPAPAWAPPVGTAPPAPLMPTMASSDAPSTPPEVGAQPSTIGASLLAAIARATGGR